MILTKIGAMGFGGGIMPSFFLTMKTDKIKAFVNLEGGVFQGASLTTKSVDYRVEKMKTPMLHIVTYGTKKDESAAEINAIKSAPIYRVQVEDMAVKHQDFSIFGRIALHGLGMRGEISPDVEKAYIASHSLLLDFFDQLLRKSKK